MPEFFVPGLPVGKGSLRAFTRKGGGVGVEEGNADKVRPWMSAITLAARDAGLVAVKDAIVLELAFYMPRPKGHYFTGKRAGIVRPDAPSVPTGKPDIDKLERAVLDALTGVAYVDDSQVVEIRRATKRYARAEGPGIRIGVTRYAHPTWADLELAELLDAAAGVEVVR